MVIDRKDNNILRHPDTHWIWETIRAECDAWYDSDFRADYSTTYADLWNVVNNLGRITLPRARKAIRKYLDSKEKRANNWLHRPRIEVTFHRE